MQKNAKKEDVMLVTKLSSNGIYASIPPEVRGHVFYLEFNNGRVILIIPYPF